MHLMIEFDSFRDTARARKKKGLNGEEGDAGSGRIAGSIIGEETFAMLLLDLLSLSLSPAGPS